MTERENEAQSPNGSPSDAPTNASTEESTAMVVDSGTAANRAGAETPEEPQNRRARRASAARARKVRGQERAEAEAMGLDAQEILDEALTRSTDTASRWLRQNSGLLQGLLAAGLLAWAGWGLYSWRTEASRAQASDALALAVQTGLGVIGEPEKQGQPNEQGVIDPTPIFKDATARQKAMQAAFEQASQLRSGSAAAAYAQLGLAASLLDDKQYDAAFSRFEAAKNGEPAKTDAEIKGRAVEGLALVLEGKGDLPGALKHYKELAALGSSGFALVGLYGQARLEHATGNDAAAKDTVTALNTRLAAKPSADAPAFAPPGYIKQGAKLLSDVLGIVPPTPAAPPEGNTITQEQLQRLQQQVQEQLNQAGKKGPDGEKQ